MSKEVIGIIGTIGSGKDTAGDYIAAKLHVPVFQISSPLKQICAEKQIEPTRENLIALGTQLAAEYGDGYLAEYILEHMPDRAVITGMRQLGQITALQASSRLTLIAIDADTKIRFVRTRTNGKLGEASNIEKFCAREEAENAPPNAQRLFECMKLAQYRIINEASLTELKAQLDHILTHL